MTVGIKYSDDYKRIIAENMPELLDMNAEEIDDWIDNEFLMVDDLTATYMDDALTDLEKQYGCQLYQMDKTQMLIAAARIIKIKSEIEDKEK